MKATQCGVNYDLIKDREVFPLKTRDYVLGKYCGLPQNELKYILWPYFQSNMQLGVRYWTETSTNRRQNGKETTGTE